MSIDEMKVAIDDLVNSDEKIEIPGLQLSSVAEHLVDTKHKNELDEIENEKDRSDKRQELIEYYVEGNGKDMVEMEINSIKSNFSAAKAQLEQIADAAVSAVASNAVPAVITVGQATSTANTAYALIENKTKKTQLLSMLKTVENFLVNLLVSAVKIAFEIPAMIGNLITLLATTKKTINSIPV